LNFHDRERRRRLKQDHNLSLSGITGTGLVNFLFAGALLGFRRI
jgi:hypothetical protein